MTSSRRPHCFIVILRDPKRATNSVRIFRAIIAPFILFFEILDMSRKTVTLETCPKARRLPERGNADAEIINQESKTTSRSSTSRPLKLNWPESLAPQSHRPTNLIPTTSRVQIYKVGNFLFLRRAKFPVSVVNMSIPELRFSKLQILSAVTSSTLRKNDPNRSCNNEECEKLGALFCSRCKFYKYCGRECQKADWIYHGKECKRLSGARNVVVDQDSHPKGYRFNRPNIFLELQTTKKPMSIVYSALMKILLYHNFRIGYFGASRIEKAIFFLEDAEDCETFIDRVVAPCFESVSRSSSHERETFCAYHDKLEEGERSRIREDYMKEESTIRILAVAPRTDIHIITPDVEFMGLLVMEDIAPKEMNPKWQKMARKEGMRGHLLMLAPAWLKEPTTAEELEEENKPEATDEEVGEWRPKSWQPEITSDESDKSDESEESG